MNSLFYEVNRVPEIRHIDISKWDVSNVTTMNSMFYKCHEFDCDLSEGDVSKVTDMSHMFEYCLEVNFDVGKWKLNDKVTARDIIHGAVQMKNIDWWWNLPEKNKK